MKWKSSELIYWQKALGFTLSELLLVFAILSFLLTLAVPAVRQMTEVAHLKSSARRLGALMRHTAEQSLFTGRTHGVMLDQRAGEYFAIEVESESTTMRRPSPIEGTKGELPETICFEKIKITEQQMRNAGRDIFYFKADGSATAGEVVLEIRGKKLSYHIIVKTDGQIQVK